MPAVYHDFLRGLLEAGTRVPHLRGEPEVEKEARDAVKSKEGWDGESLVCTGRRCGQRVLSGAGNQFIDDNGILQRYCWRCWVRMINEGRTDGTGSEKVARAAGSDGGD
jgi:hypothetical protein